jgi:hypothetical protein
MSSERKPRVPIVRVDFGRAQTLSGMNLSDDGKLTFYDENGKPVAPASIEVDSSYGRKKGPKILGRVVADPQSIDLNLNRALAQYPHVFAIDTNTIETDAGKISMCVPCLIRDIEIGPTKWDAKLISQDAFEFRDATAAPEKIGWCEFTALLQKEPLAGPVGIIVDAHLVELAPINARRQPILGRYFLPAGIELIYASSDVGKREYIGAAAMVDCDNIASQLLKQAQLSPDVDLVPASPGSPFGKQRIWVPPEKPSGGWTSRRATRNVPG